MSDAPPPKPWEINRTSTSGNFGPLHSSTNSPAPDSGNVNRVDTSRGRTPPPVPSRASQRGGTPMGYQPSGFGGYSNYGSGYAGMYGGGMYGGYGGGMYSGYGSSMYGYNRPYANNGSFSRQAEESTRNAFQSVESIVRAFTSVSAMLESTLGAVYSSFRAVLDVADHFSRVRATFADILSSITLFRLIRYLYRRVRAFLRMGSCEEAWESVNDNAAVTPSKRKSKSWPILLFVSVVIGGPYLIWRLLSNVTTPKPPTSWANGISDHVVAQAEYDFEGENEDELSLKVGDVLHLAPKEQQPHIRDWLLASLDGVTIGMVPANYVKILGKRKGRKPKTETHSNNSLEKVYQAAQS